MDVPFCCRIEKSVLKKADRVAKRLGTSTSELVRIFITQMARTGRITVNLNADGNDSIALTPWQGRAPRLESFYDPSKTW
jgi:antitoxin component of RelBE/YafQ-DinJ toxin-antitoxin module